MYVSPRKKRVYTIIALLVVLLIPVSVIGFLLYEDYRSRAAPEEKPEDVRISDVTETSAVISWITPEQDTEGWILYSDESGVADGSPLAQDDRDVRSGTIEQRHTHYVTLSNLQPDTTYYFVIGSGQNTWRDPEGDEFTLATAPIGSETIPTPDPVYGTVTNGEDQSAIIYVTLDKDGERSAPVSALTNDSGNFEVDLAHIRNASLTEKFEYDDDTEMIVFAQGGDVGGAVLRVAVGDRDAVSLTMEEDYPETDIFAEGSDIPVGGETPPGETPGGETPGETPGGGTPGESPGGGTPGESPTTPQEPSNPEESEEPAESESVYPPGTPTTRQDIPLTALILGTQASQSGISNIQITNVTENSFTVVWTSAQAEVGSLSYGTDGSSLTGEARDSRDSLVSQESYYTHHVSVGDLTPQTIYYYEINSGTQTYDNSGSPYQVTLPATQDSPPEFYSIFGEVEGTGASDAIVIGRIVGAAGTSSYISSAVENGGTWTLSIGGVRTQDYADYFSYTSDDTLELTVRTNGAQVSETYILGDIGDDVIDVTLNMIEQTSGSAFNRGLYAVISSLNNLPDTAVSRLTALGLTIAVLLIGYGTYLLFSVYSSERTQRWEQDVLRDLE